MSGNRIGDTTIFPITTPADGDLLLGTDVSNTSNNAVGETVSFTVGSISSSKITALAEGASGQPRILPAALLIYEGTGTASNASGTILTLTDLDDTPVLLCDLQLEGEATSGNSTTPKIQYRTSTDNGSTYGAYSDLFEITANDGGATSRQMQLVVLGASDNAVQFYFLEGANAAVLNNSGTVTVVNLGRTSS